MQTAPLRSIVTYVAAAAGILLACRVFDDVRIQPPEFTIPYLSGAANYRWDGVWRVDPHDIFRYREISPDQPKSVPSAEQAEHRFSASDQAVPFASLDRGYLYVAIVARTLFFWRGDLAALESLQIAVHVLLTLWVCWRLPRRRQKVLFYVLFGLNPLIVRFATLPIYYYWQAIPSCLLVVYLLDRRHRFGAWVFGVAVLLALVHQIRPTMLLTSLYLLSMVTWRESRWRGAAAIVLLLGITFAISPRDDRAPWHTAYVGLGAYPNDYVIGIEDSVGYRRYEEVTGERADITAEGNILFDPQGRARYREVMRQSYLEVVREAPYLPVRNAAENFLQSFSIGYIAEDVAVGGDRVLPQQLLSHLSAVVGLVWLGVLCWRRQYLFIAGIACASLLTVVLFPPIPAYMFGSYPLLVGSLIAVVDSFWPPRPVAQSKPST